MADSNIPSVRKLLFLHTSLLFSLLLPTPSHGGMFDAIYQFGDSISDTGNLVMENPSTPFCSKLPYGETFFRHPTGRCSDGLLMIDFVARAFHLPFLKPYLEKGADFTHGVNFAVSGATALDASTLAARSILSQVTNSSLSVQLSWFRSHLKSICSSPSECKDKLARSLFIMGEIGGNDYDYALLQGKTLKAIYNLVPEVVHAIKNAVQEVIEQGASKVVVPGDFPLGCLPIFLVLFRSQESHSYDHLNCLKHLNDLSRFHNDHLERAIRELQQQHPGAVIIYGDYYSATTWILQNAAWLGFEKDGGLTVCCGAGNNEYNYNSTESCGSTGVAACPDPARRVSWDGLHFTQQGYKYMAYWLLRRMGLRPDPNIRD
ncbi:hypothetical protein Ancab_035521 [Ancistrocladus abbreviatus]